MSFINIIISSTLLLLLHMLLLVPTLLISYEFISYLSVQNLDESSLSLFFH